MKILVSSCVCINPIGFSHIITGYYICGREVNMVHTVSTQKYDILGFVMEYFSRFTFLLWVVSGLKILSVFTYSCLFQPRFTEKSFMFSVV